MLASDPVDDGGVLPLISPPQGEGAHGALHKNDDPKGSAANLSARRDVLRAGATGTNAGEPSSMWEQVKKDYVRHGRAFSNPAFIALAAYRLGRWSLMRRSRPGRYMAGKLYGFVNFFVANWTKVWMSPRVQVGEDFHIIHAEGSLSIHPDVVIGDRVGVMHNVTIGATQRPGAPVIGDDVFIGVNSVVLGKVRVGDRVSIAANTCVMTNVPSDSVVVGSPARIFPRLGPVAGARKPPAQPVGPDATHASGQVS